MEMSNKSLALLLVAAIVISLGGTLISLNKLNQEGLTGMIGSGLVQLNVSQNMSCNIDSNVSFGTAGQPSGVTTLSTAATNSGSGFNDCTSAAACYGMMINNTGNVNVNVTFSSNYNGTTLLGGPGATNDDFQYSAVNGSNSGAADPGCNTGLKTTWGEANATTTTICTNLTYTDANDIMTIEYNATIDQNTPVSLKTATITITCAAN